MGFKRVIFLVTAILTVSGISIRAQDAGALLDLLVKKKLITDQEAEEVRAELTKESATTSAGKWKLSTPITELELYGDTRLRYEIRQGETDSQDTQQRNLPRYRLRLGLRGILADDWVFGVRLETGTNPRSSNVTFGDDSGGGNGPFAKNSDGIFVGQAYLSYKGFKDITLTAGKMPNPMVSTLMVWDPDINPEGLAEQWKHTFTIALGDGAEEPETSYSKDGTALPGKKKKKTEAHGLKIEVFANFAQFIYDDANPENPLGPRPITTANGGHQLIPNADAFLLAWQLGAKFTFPNNLYAQIAPTFYNYSGNGDSFNVHFQGGDPKLSNAASLAQNQTGINSLLVFDLPMEVGWKLGDIPMRL